MDAPHNTNPLYSMKKTPSQARSRATIDAILEAATRILIQFGYDKASTNKIAELAGVGIGSVYEYFPGKEAIFAEVRRREDYKLFELIMGRPEPETVRGLLELHIPIYLEFVRSNLVLHAALINDVPQFAVGQRELPFYRDYGPWLIDFLRLHQDELRPLDNIPLLAEFTNRVSRATIDNYVLHSPEQLADPQIELMLIDMLEHYLLKPADKQAMRD
ncbi:MAG: helix-turn-helix domain-containing protein [Halioglobus sp.]